MRSRRIQQASNRLQRSLQRERDAYLVKRELSQIMRTSQLARNEVNDLIACAWLGLYDARQRFDPSLGYSFAAFASARIRGAIYDGLAELGTIGSRGIRFIKRAQVMSELQSGRGSEDADELRNVEGVLVRDVDFVEEYDHLKSQIALSLLGHMSEVTTVWGEVRYVDQSQALHDTLYSTLNGTLHSTLHDTLSAARHHEPGRTQSEARRLDECEAPERKLIKREELGVLREHVSQAFEALSARDQEVLIAVYDLRDVGDSAARFAERLGVHRSTVTRRRVVALTKLRSLIIDPSALERLHSSRNDTEVSRASA